jgi:uncharacterized protein YbjQ (UPF0145 family)
MDFLFDLTFFLALLTIGLFFGRAAEKRHFRELVRREAELRDILVFSERRLPADRAFHHATLVVGSVVIAEDYFKRIAAALRSFVGGRLTAYESLMDRGRREAIVRMKEQARRRGATLVFNVRFETASLADSSARGQALFSAEFIAYGTALVPGSRA